jgi:ribosomal protein L11 methyltransferase
MAWQQLVFSASAIIAEQLNELLMETESLAVTMQDAADQAIFEPALGTTPLWGNTQLIALYDQHVDLQAVLAQLQSQFGSLPPYQITEVAERAWERVWMDEFKPMQFGKRLWICPSWCTPPDPTGVSLSLDPGLAFGTGTHPTTRLCLEWLDANPPSGLSVIDYGCGSGILALAALKLGAKTLSAVDTDPQALLATHDNGLRNDLHIATFLPEQLPPLSCEVLLANILAQPLIDLAPTLANLVRPQGRIVLSGILAEQAHKVSAAYQTWFAMQEVVQLDEWVRLTGIRLS